MTKNMDPALFAETQARIDRQKRQAIADKVAAATADQPRKSSIVPPYIVPAPLEADIQKAVLLALKGHRKVAWAVRMNSGQFKVGEPGKERWVRAGFKGCPDLWLQMRDGRLGVCEVKRPGEHPTPEQSEFLTRVRANNGVAFIARSVLEALNYLEAA